MCGRCEIMPTRQECVCCCDIVEVQLKKETTDEAIQCITLHPGFEAVCLNVWVLQTAYYDYHQHYGNTMEESINE